MVQELGFEPGPRAIQLGRAARSATDEDPVAEGIQYRDVGALSGGRSLFYRITANNFCGESPPN